MDKNEFICPECGSGDFGSYHDEIICHGYILIFGRDIETQPCTFRGKRADVMHESVPLNLKKARIIYNAIECSRIICSKKLQNLLNQLDRANTNE